MGAVRHVAMAVGLVAMLMIASTGCVGTPSESGPDAGSVALVGEAASEEGYELHGVNDLQRLDDVDAIETADVVVDEATSFLCFTTSEPGCNTGQSVGSLCVHGGFGRCAAEYTWGSWASCECRVCPMQMSCGPGYWD